MIAVAVKTDPRAKLPPIGTLKWSICHCRRVAVSPAVDNDPPFIGSGELTHHFDDTPCDGEAAS